MFALLLFCFNQSMAQQQKRIVQLSGFILASESKMPKVGVAVYVSGTMRSTQTNEKGFFSLAVAAGDSIVFSALGYRGQSLVVPADYNQTSYTITVSLSENTTLSTVDVMPWATERDLKEAISKLKVPEEKQQIVIPEPVEIKSVLNAPALGAEGNFRYFNQQQTQQRESRYRVTDIIRGLGIPIRYKK